MPDPPEDKVEKKEVEEEEKTDKEPVKEPVKESDKPKFIEIENPVTGEIEQFTPDEARQLLQYGLMQVTKQQKPEEEPVEDKNKIESLEAKIKKMEEDAKQEKRNAKILNMLETSSRKFDLTKDDQKMSDKIKTIVLAKLQYNPRLDISEEFASEVADFMEIQKVKDNANSKVSAAVSGVVTGGSALPVIDTEKEYTAEDLKTNVAREAMRKFLENREA